MFEPKSKGPSINGRVAEWCKTGVFYFQGLWFKPMRGTFGKCLKTMFHGSNQAMWGNWVVSRDIWRNTWWSYSLTFMSCKLLSDYFSDVKLTLPYLALKYARIELGRFTAEGTCRSPCGLNPHGHRQVPSALGKIAWKLSWKWSINNGMTQWNLCILLP